jgi:hypothetical protein
MFIWICIVLALWNNSTVDSHVAPLGHIILIPSQPGFALSLYIYIINATCLAEKQQIPILLSLVWPDRSSNPRSTALDASTLTITSPMWLLFLYIWGLSWLYELDLQLYVPVQLVSVTTTVVSLNPIHSKVYSIQHYVIKFVSDLQQVDCFFRILHFPPPIKLIATI